MCVLGCRASVSGLRWERSESDERLVLTLVQRYHFSPLLAEILISRGILPDDVPAFIEPTLKSNLPHPFSLKDMEKAALRMARAVMRGEPIGLMGDYDVDGATSVAELKMFLLSCGIQVFTFIPERDDGYGPNAKKMKEFADLGCSVVATLDCGVTAFEPIQAGTDLGLDVIVLDHHSPEKTLPNAYAVVNPKRLDEPVQHPCRHMAAVGVVFLFIVALNKVLREKGFFKERQEPDLKAYLDLVALGTICDVVPLKGVNRLFVKAGLKHMKGLENHGIKALAETAGISGEFNAYHLGYVLGPRINACGRIGQSDVAMRLLSCTDAVTAKALATELEDLNVLRRDIEAAVLLEAIEQVESKPLDVPFIFVKGENWHQGVVGIVAGRLKDKYHLPVFALSIEGDEVKGSSRSVDGVDLGTLIMKALNQGILTRGGGHMKAAGFSLRRDQMEAFYQYLVQEIHPESLQMTPTLQIDGVLDIAGVTQELLESLKILEPFGESNPEPKFVIKDVMITYPQILKNGHVSCALVGRSGGRLNAIAFRAVDTQVGTTLLKNQNHYFHVAGTLKLDTWKGNTKIQMYIEDLVAA